MSLLGLSFLIRGIIFDLVFSIFARTFEVGVNPALGYGAIMGAAGSVGSNKR